MDDQPSSTPTAHLEPIDREQQAAPLQQPSEQTRAWNDEQTELEERSFVLGYN